MPLVLLPLTEGLNKVRSLLSLSPGDLATPEGRSRERYRRVALTWLAATATRVIGLGTSLVSVPLTLRYLGVERYGMWMTITSIVIMLGSADLGMGNGLITLVADAMGREDREEARRAISSAFWMLSSIAFLIVLVAAVAYPFVPWNRLFNVHSALAISESGPALMVFLACVAVNLPLNVIGNIQTGLQNGFVNNLWAIAGSFFSLGALLLAIHFHAGLPALILGLSGGPILGLLLNGAQLFSSKEPSLLPSVRFFSAPAARGLLRMGLMFFLLQLSISIAYQSDNVVIAQIMGAGAVSAYAIPARLFNIVASLLALVSGAMWPAYADAKARSDGAWIRKSYVRTTIFGVGVSAALTAVLIIFGNRIIAVWVNLFSGGGPHAPVIQASALLLTIFGIRCVLNAYLQPINFLMNGVNELKVQVIAGLTMAVVNIALSIIFVKWFGVVGAVLGTVVAETFVLVIPMTIALNRTLRRLTAA
ncbi:MAG TPA: oligosaccharide flippase family protein [Acidisarcina sp.]